MPNMIDLTGDDEDDIADADKHLHETFEDEDDADLRKAICMSLHQPYRAETPSDTTLASDHARDDDDDLRKAIALSLQAHNSITTTIQQPTCFKEQQHETPGPIQESSRGVLGLDRKLMEAERLARLKRKREAEDQSPPVSPPPLRRQERSLAAPISQSIAQSTGIKNTEALSPPFSFPQPKVLLTSHPSRHTPTAISFRDVISPPMPNLTLKSTILSSFIADFDWLLPHFDTRTVKFLLILHAHNAQHRQMLQSDFAGVPNVRLIIPECLGGGGNMHSKLMLLFYKDEQRGEEVCRIAIPSANLIPADWGVGGTMENVVTVVDLPIKRNHVADSQVKEATQFERELTGHLHLMGVSGDVLRKLTRFDFRSTHGVGYVHSMSGSRILQTNTSSSTNSQQSQAGGFFANSSTAQRASAKSQTAGEANRGKMSSYDDPARTGLLSLSDVVTSLGLAVSPDEPAYPPQLDYVTSSLGNLSTQFVRQLYQAVCGQLKSSPALASNTPARSKLSRKENEEDAKLDDLVKRHLRMYFPSEDTVNKSKGGPSHAGTICFQPKWWESNNLIRECLRDCVGIRDDGILMHGKILYVRFDQPKPVKHDNGNTTSYAGWAYIGSANLSESAWGRLIDDTRTRQSKLTCRNWESGVVIPIPCEGRRHPRGVGFQVDLEGGASRTADVNASVSDMHHEGKEMHMKRERDPALLDGEVSRSVLINEKIPTSPTSLELSHLNEVFSNHVPVPMRYPAESYVTNNKQPWFFGG